MPTEASFEDVANSLFAKENPALCNWDTLKLASKKGVIKTKFVFHTNHFKSLVKNPSNNVFFQGLISIKYLVGLIWLIYYLFTTKDFLFLLTLPASFVFSFIIEFFWHRRFIVTLLAVAAITTIGKLLSLNGHYYYYLTFIILISSQIHSVYNTFLTELFYDNETNFVYGIDKQYISEIFDGMKRKTYKGPFFIHNIKS